MSTGAITVTSTIQFARRHHGRREIQPIRSEAVAVPAGTVPRVSRLMAMALRFDRLIRAGAVGDQADLARLGHVTRARVTQIMNLLHLAPDIQEALLFLPRTLAGRDVILDHDMRAIAAVVEWPRQRELWRQLVARKLNHI